MSLNVMKSSPVTYFWKRMFFVAESYFFEGIWDIRHGTQLNDIYHFATTLKWVVLGRECVPRHLAGVVMPNIAEWMSLVRCRLHKTRDSSIIRVFKWR